MNCFKYSVIKTIYVTTSPAFLFCVGQFQSTIGKKALSHLWVTQDEQGKFVFRKEAE